MISCRYVVILSSVAVLSAAASARADTKISLKQLPAAVRQAADQHLEGGVIKGASTEVENGRTLYEVETTKAGHSRDLLLDAEGHLVSVEEAVVLDAVPAPVRAALSAHGKVIGVERVTKGSTISYEGVVERGGKRTEVMVDAAGTPIKP